MTDALPPITFRAATMADAERLFHWRNDPYTRKQSHNSNILQYDEHIAWLAKSLKDPKREIRIAESAGIAVGTIRLDKSEDSCELSWTVAPEYRGKSFGKSMLKTALAQLSMPAYAQIKQGNSASKRMVEFAGMTLEREENGILHYQYAPVIFFP